jgi:hydroxyacylglutathione hydrolase
MTVTLHVACALSDNYVYLLEDPASRRAVVVDPGESAPVLAVLDRIGAELEAIWCTHHHGDHIGGIAGLLARFPRAAVVGSAYDAELRRIPQQTHALGDGDPIAFAGATGRALHIPGHTLGHVAYLIENQLFPGDTLFGSGCGRLFEGTPRQMHDALARLRALPPDTRVWCGHEYTLMNLRFAAELEPDNAALRARLAAAEARPGAETVPMTVADERATNPFLRCDEPALQRLTGETDPVAVFASVRTTRNGWKAAPVSLDRCPFSVTAW